MLKVCRMRGSGDEATRSERCSAGNGQVSGRVFLFGPAQTRRPQTTVKLNQCPLISISTQLQNQIKIRIKLLYNDARWSLRVGRTARHYPAAASRSWFPHPGGWEVSRYPGLVAANDIHYPALAPRQGGAIFKGGSLGRASLCLAYHSPGYPAGRPLTLPEQVNYNKGVSIMPNYTSPTLGKNGWANRGFGGPEEMEEKRPGLIVRTIVPVSSGCCSMATRFTCIMRSND